MYLSSFSAAITEYTEWVIHKEQKFIWPMVLEAGKYTVLASGEGHSMAEGRSDPM